MVDVAVDHGEVDHGLHILGSSDLVMTGGSMAMISEFESKLFWDTLYRVIQRDCRL